MIHILFFKFKYFFTLKFKISEINSLKLLKNGKYGFGREIAFDLTFLEKTQNKG